MRFKLQYASDVDSLQSAAGLLRATAELNGIALREASAVDMAAAVYAAEQWCLAHRTRTLDFPGVHGEEAVKSLAAVLTRASGRRHGAGKKVASLPRDDAWEAVTEELAVLDQWEVARRVVGDLTYGGSQVLADWVTLRLGSPTGRYGETGAAS